MSAKEESKEIDESLYSRQLYVLGMETMVALSKTNVLIHGLNGLGVEVAKNVILAGPKSVTVHDDSKVELSDLSSQFYFAESDVGKSRSCCTTKLAELNRYVSVKSIEGDLTEEVLSRFQVVVLTNACPKEQTRINEYCHKNGIVTIIADAFGLFGSIFTDFGEFIVKDQNGETPDNILISEIIQEEEGLVVSVLDEKLHGFDENDLVLFEEVKGMTSLNDGKPRKVIKRNGRYVFTIEGKTDEKYESGGIVHIGKFPKLLKHKSLEEALPQPGELILSDFAKFDRPPQAHIAYRALRQFIASNNGLPDTVNKEHAATLIKIANEINEAAKEKKELSVEKVDEKLLTQIAYFCKGNCNPMCAFLGGIVGQEVLKVSGKFHPIDQFFYFDAFECLPDDYEKNLDQFKPTQSRYDGQIAAIGKDLHTKLENLKLFLVGAGALGCELLKNFALMGVAASKNGLCTLTDLDNIEKSNLNRQFLFRDRNIGQMKSKAAAESVKVMNPAFNIVTHETPVGNDTEDVFTDAFWEKQDLIVNALDNMKARLYVDSKCVLHNKPLLESGTLGTKANTQVILPKRTESYGSSQDPPEKSIPMCTLKNFPHQIEHTIEWARDTFTGLFSNGAGDVNNYLDDNNYFDTLKQSQTSVASQRKVLEYIHKTLKRAKAISFDDCIEEARNLFEDYFSNQIKQLLFNFPPDKVTSSGAKFWSPPKRCPSPLTFDPNDSTHLSFVMSCANLIAFNFNIKENRDEAYFKKTLEGIKVPEFKPRTGVRIKESEKDETDEGNDDDDEVVAKLEKSIPNQSEFKDFRMQVAKFEKDDDSNFHIDFITATSNLRARNYAIKEKNRRETKGIAGRIIPAIATTTAMITGLVCLELYKVIQKDKNIEAFKNGFVNLAIPLWAFSEPLSPLKHKSTPADSKDFERVRAYPEDWTIWDNIVIDEGDITIQQLIDVFKTKHNLEVGSIAAGTALIYNSYIPKHQARKNTKVTEVWQQLQKKQLYAGKQYITLIVTVDDPDDDDVEVDIPDVRLKFC